MTDARNSLSPLQEAESLLQKAHRLNVIFNRLFWVASAGGALFFWVVVFANWEANPGWCVGLAGIAQAWLAAAALWAFQVYARAERLEKAARAMGVPEVSSDI